MLWEEASTGGNGVFVGKKVGRNPREVMLGKRTAFLKEYIGS